MPPVFRYLGDLYAARALDIVALFNDGERTLIHGDTHSGNLFVDAGRTGFYDWGGRWPRAWGARRRLLPLSLASRRNPSR